jgi:hypothetical protein
MMPFHGAALAAGRAGQCFVHDAPDRARTAAALRTAPETAVDLASGSGSRGRDHGAADVMVGQHIARTNDHGENVVIVAEETIAQIS